MTTGIAIIGAGRWGVNLIRNFLKHPDAQIITVVDAFIDNLQSLSQKMGDLWDDNIILTTDYNDIFNMSNIQSVVIVTPAVTHYELIKICLEKGFHILAEKPLTILPEESFKLCDLALEKQRLLIVDHTYLFNPVVKAGKLFCEEKKIGDLRYGYATRTNLGPVRYDVDAMWDLVIHDIAIFNNWLGESPIQVQAMGNSWLQSNLADVVWIKLIYPSGFNTMIHVSWLNPDKQRRLGIVGSKGTLIFDELLPNPLTFYGGCFSQQGIYFIPDQQYIENISFVPDEPLFKVVDHFLECVRENKESHISSGWLGANLVRIVNCLNQSLQQGGIIVNVD